MGLSTAILDFIASIFGAEFSGWRKQDEQKKGQEHVVEAYRDEAKGMAEPAKPWRHTVDDL